MMPPTNPNEDDNPFSPKRKWKKQHKQNAEAEKEDSPDNSCPICLGSLADQQIATPECCDHTFCLVCIKEWASKVKTCPVDRLPFTLLLVRQGNQASISTVLTVRAPGVFEPLGGRGEQQVVECSGCHLRVPKCGGIPFPLRLVAGHWYCLDCHLNLMDLDSAPDPPLSMVPPLLTAGDLYDVIHPEPAAIVKSASLLVPGSHPLQLVTAGSSMVDSAEISSFEHSRSPDVLGSILQSQLQLHRSSVWSSGGARQCPQSPGSSSSGSPRRPSSPQSSSRPSSPSIAMGATALCREPGVPPDTAASFLMDASFSLSIKSPTSKKVPVSDDDVDIYSDIESLHENDLDREPAPAPSLQPLVAAGDSAEDSSENELVIDLQAAASSTAPIEECAPVESSQLKPSYPQDLSDQSSLSKLPPQATPAPSKAELYDPFNIEDSFSSASGNNTPLTVKEKTPSVEAESPEVKKEDPFTAVLQELISQVEQLVNEFLPPICEDEKDELVQEPASKKLKLDLEQETDRIQMDPPTPEIKVPEPEDFILEKNLTAEPPKEESTYSSGIKLPETEDISDTEDEPFPPESIPEDDDREEGEIVEVEEVKKPSSKRKKQCKKHHKGCHKGERSPSVKSGESGEIRDNSSLFKTKGYEKFSLILGDQYEKNVGWKRLSKSNKDRSYRDGKPRDEEVLFKVRELKRKRKSNVAVEESKKKKESSDGHHKTKKNEKTKKKDRSRTRERSPERSRSRGRRRSRSKTRSHSRSRYGRGSSQNRNKSHIRSRNNHHSRNRSRSRNNSRARSRSLYRPPRARSRSRNRKYGRSRSRKRSTGRSRSRNRSYGRSRSRNRRSPYKSRYQSNKRSRHSKSLEKSRSRNRSYEKSRHSRSFSRNRNDDKKINRHRRDRYSSSRSSTQERSRSADRNKAKLQPVKTKEKGKAKPSKKPISNQNVKSQVVSEEIAKPKSVGNMVKTVGKKKKASAITVSEQDKNGEISSEGHKATKKKHHGEKKTKVKKKKKHACPHEHARKKERNILTVDDSLKIELEKHEPCSKSELYADTLISKLEQQSSKPPAASGLESSSIGNSLESKEIYTKGDSIIINLNFNNSSNKEELAAAADNHHQDNIGSPLLKENGPRENSEEKQESSAPEVPDDLYWHDAISPASGTKEEKEESLPLAKEHTPPSAEKTMSSPSSTGGDSYDPCQPTLSPDGPEETEVVEAGAPSPSLPSNPACLSLLPNALMYLAQLKPSLLPTPPKFIGGPPLQAVLPAFPPAPRPQPEKRKASVAPLKRAKMEESSYSDGSPDTKDASDPSSSEKFLLKLNRQERVIEEVKMVLKPFYNKRDIDKDDYKEILRKSVPKICHNKSREINPIKIKHLVEGYVKKYKYLRKKLRKQPIEY